LPSWRQSAEQVRTTGCCRTTEWNLTGGTAAGLLPAVVTGGAERLPSTASADLATVADRGNGRQATRRDRMQAPGPTGDAKGQDPLSAEAAARSRGDECWSLCGSCICRTSWMPRSRRKWLNCPPWQPPRWIRLPNRLRYTPTALRPRPRRRVSRPL
ncbi:MAG: hypothetical protein ACK56F_25665, partial [bacterium]